MTLGISTYAYFWRSSEVPRTPMTIEHILDDAVRLGLSLVQICDWAGLADLDEQRLNSIRAAAEQRGLALEVGTKGILPGHLRRYLAIAERLGAPLLRSMLHTPEHRPGRNLAEAELREVMPEFEAAGVTLALETYELVPTADLVDIVTSVGSPLLGVCLDPGNAVAALEHPDWVIETTAPFVKNVHVKDFAFTRSPDMIGFRLAGVPMGQGLLDYGHLQRAVEPERRGVNLVIEQWCPWQGEIEETMRVEAEWVEIAVRYLTGWQG